MHLLRARPISNDPDDGVNAVYECQACLHITNHVADAYATPNHIRCGSCGYYEGDNDADD